MSSAEQRPIGPPEVASRVAEILRTAEADARAIIAAAHGTQAPPEPLGDALAERLDQLEAAILERLDVLEALLRAQPAASGNPQERDAGTPADEARIRAARLRAVDLALQGRSRAEIGAELASIVGPPALEQLLAEVFEER